MNIKYTFLFLLFFSSFLAIGQDDSLDELNNSEFDVPEAIVDNHGYYFPGSIVDDWQKHTLDDTDLFIANFSHSGKSNMLAVYKEGGQRVMYSEFLPTASIPAPIGLKIQAGFGDFKVVSGQLLTFFKPERQIYQVLLRKEAQDKKLYFDKLGNVLDETVLPALLIE